MPRPTRRHPNTFSEQWLDILCTDQVAEIARQLANILRAITDRAWLRTVARTTVVDHSVLSRILTGETWADTHTLARLEHTLNTPLWPNHADEPDRGFCSNMGPHTNVSEPPSLAAGPSNLTAWSSGRNCQRLCQQPPENLSLGDDRPPGHAGTDASWSRALRSLDGVEVIVAADEPTHTSTFRPLGFAHVAVHRSGSRHRTLSHPPRTFSPTAHGRIAHQPPRSQRDPAHVATTSAPRRSNRGSAPCPEPNR